MHFVVDVHFFFNSQLISPTPSFSHLSFLKLVSAVPFNLKTLVLDIRCGLSLGCMGGGRSNITCYPELM